MSTKPLVAISNPAQQLLEPYVSPEEAAAFLGIRREAVLLMAREGRLPAHPIFVTGKRRQWRFKLSELDKHMKHVDTSRNPPVRQ